MFSSVPRVKTPPALWVLVSLKMWESFSYYGMQALLVLYLTQSLGFTDTRALGLYAIYAALVELTSVYGGVIGDRIGYQKSVALGSSLIVLGHAAMTISGLPIYLGLGLIALGSGLFRPNTTAILGSIYSTADEDLRESGFTLFYSALNLGGFLAGCTCGYVGENIGWHYGFGLAAIGMVIGWVVFAFYKHLLPQTSVQNSPSILYVGGALILSLATVIGLLYFHEVAFWIVPFMLVGCVFLILYKLKETLPEERKNIAVIALFTLLLALFFAIEEQIGSTLVLFASRHVDREIFGAIMPASSLVAINPLVIIIGGFLLSRIKTKGGLKHGFLKVTGAFGLQLIAFALLYLSCVLSVTAEDISITAVIMAMGCIGFSELFIGPTVWAICAQLSPKRFQGTLMGLVMLGYALGNILAGHLSRLMAVDLFEGELPTLAVSLSIYQDGFYILCEIGIGAMLLSWILQRLMPSHEVRAS